MSEPVRFVVLRHEGIAEPHYDLMFDVTPGGKLATWRSPSWPVAADQALTRLDDHRRDYLDYEGPVSRDRGHVRRVCAGLCRIEVSPDLWRIEFVTPSDLSPLLIRT